MSFLVCGLKVRSREDIGWRFWPPVVASIIPGLCPPHLLWWSWVVLESLLWWRWRSLSQPPDGGGVRWAVTAKQQLNWAHLSNADTEVPPHKHFIPELMLTAAACVLTCLKRRTLSSPLRSRELLLGARQRGHVTEQRC